VPRRGKAEAKEVNSLVEMLSYSTQLYQEKTVSIRRKRRSGGGAGEDGKGRSEEFYQYCCSSQIMLLIDNGQRPSN
jgi:hypothetical protein